jgi:hypothetical protein
MKTKEIAKGHGLDAAAFDRWLKQSGHQYKSGMTGLTVADNVNTDDLVSNYNLYLAQEQQRLAQEQERLAQEQANADRVAQEKQRALSSMLITFRVQLRRLHDHQILGLHLGRRCGVDGSTIARLAWGCEQGCRRRLVGWSGAHQT